MCDKGKDKIYIGTEIIFLIQLLLFLKLQLLFWQELLLFCARVRSVFISLIEYAVGEDRVTCYV